MFKIFQLFIIFHSILSASGSDSLQSSPQISKSDNKEPLPFSLPTSFNECHKDSLNGSYSPRSISGQTDNHSLGFSSGTFEPSLSGRPSQSNSGTYGTPTKRARDDSYEYVMFSHNMKTASNESAISPNYTIVMSQLKPIVKNKMINIFFMRAYSGEGETILNHIKILARHLIAAGLNIKLDILGDKGGLPYGADITRFQKQVLTTDYVMAFYSKAYYDRSEHFDAGLSDEIEHLKERLGDSLDNSFFIPVLMEDVKVCRIIPTFLRRFCAISPFNKDHSFSFDILIKEILNLFVTRIFKDHERLNDIKNILRDYIPISPESSQNSEPPFRTETLIYKESTPPYQSPIDCSLEYHSEEKSDIDNLSQNLRTLSSSSDE